MQMGHIVVLLLQLMGVVSWEPKHAAEEFMLLCNQADLVNAWVADGGEKDKIPQVDFSKEMLVAAFPGTKPTDGHTIEIKQVVYLEQGEEKGIIVIYATGTPKPDASVKQHQTNPSHVVRVPKNEASKKNIKALREDSAEAKEVLKMAQKKDR